MGVLSPLRLWSPPLPRSAFLPSEQWTQVIVSSEHVIDGGVGALIKRLWPQNDDELNFPCSLISNNHSTIWYLCFVQSTMLMCATYLWSIMPCLHCYTHEACDNLRMWWKFILEFVFYAADVTNKIVHRPSYNSQKKLMITGDMCNIFCTNLCLESARVFAVHMRLFVPNFSNAFTTLHVYLYVLHNMYITIPADLFLAVFPLSFCWSHPPQWHV